MLTVCAKSVFVWKKEKQDRRGGHRGQSTKGDLKANIKRRISSLMHVGVTPTQHGTTQTHQKRLPKPPSWPSSLRAIGRLWNPPTSPLDLNCFLVYHVSLSRRGGQRLQIEFGRRGMGLTKLDSHQHRCVMGVLSPCMRASPDFFSEREGNKKKLPFLTPVSEPLLWSDINIVFQFCLLHEVVSHRWKTLRFKLSHSLNLSAWRLPSMQFWNKEASFWFLHSVTFFDWVRLVGMEINTALCIWCSLISSPHCLQVEARDVCVGVFVSAGICALSTSALSQRSEHNNSSSSWSQLLLCARRQRRENSLKWFWGGWKGKTKPTGLLFSLWLWKHAHILQENIFLSFLIAPSIQSPE